MLNFREGSTFWSFHSSLLKRGSVLPNIKRTANRMIDMYEHAITTIRQGDTFAFKSIIHTYPELINSHKVADLSDSESLLHFLTGLSEQRWSIESIAMAKFLIDKGADVNVKDHRHYQFTPLAKACCINNVNMISTLLESGADTEYIFNVKHGKITALGLALYHYTNPILPTYSEHGYEILLKHGAKIYLPYIAAYGNLEDFLSHKDKLTRNDRSKEDLLTNNLFSEVKLALLFACKFGNNVIIEYLLKEEEIKIDEKSFFFNNELTGLHLACETIIGKPAIRLLLDYGASTKIKDKNNALTPLEWAKKNKLKTNVSTLLRSIVV